MLVRMYHNPRCSKSRAALAILQAGGVRLEIVDYLKAPPDVAGLRALRDKLGVEVRAMMRTGEAVYKQLALKDETDDTRLLSAIAAHPILLQRPLVVAGDKAVICRPPELAAQFV